MNRVGGIVRRHRWPIVSAAGLLLAVAYHAVWLVRMRNGFPVDIDEAGYLSIAYGNLDALHAGGLDGLWESFSTNAPNAPLVPLLTVPFLEVREGILPAFGVEWLALVVLGAAVYALARRLVEGPWAALAVLTVTAMPGVVNYTREFSFAVPSAAAFTVALWALVRNRNFESLPLAVAWGAAAGLAALSRTMALAILPGLVLAAVAWAALAPPGHRVRAARNLLIGTLAGVAVAATWYVRNLGAVIDYLTGYGYGGESAAYGAEHGWFTYDRWTQALYTITTQELFVPLLAVTVAVGVVALGFAARALARPGARARLARWTRSPAMPVAVFVLCGYLALSSSTNTGSAFALTILPAALVLVVALAARFRPVALRRITAGALIAVAALQLLSFAQVGTPADDLRHAVVPTLGHAPITDPRAPAIMRNALDPEAPRFAAVDREWLESTQRLITESEARAAAAGRSPVVGFGNHDIVMNTNFVNLAARLGGRVPAPLAQLTPALRGDTVEAYESVLEDPMYGQPNVLVTSGDERRDFEPVATQSMVVAAARRLGFQPFGRVAQPNGELLTLWWLDRGPSIPSAPEPAKATG